MAGVALPDDVPLMPLDKVTGLRKRAPDAQFLHLQADPLHSNLQGNGDTSYSHHLGQYAELQGDVPMADYKRGERVLGRSMGERLLVDKPGWAFGAVFAFSSVVIVFIANVATLSWASKTSPAIDGVGTIFTGDCDKINSINNWIHVLINICSTALLSGSNYCMQKLSAPTRADVDRAHARSVWLDIGIPSMRNLSKISRGRLVLWIMLGLSSVPLHLFYNSAFAHRVGVYNYIVFAVQEDFLSGTVPFDKYDIPRISGTSGGLDSLLESTNLLSLQKNQTQLQRLDNAACIQAYGNPLLVDRRHLILVTQTTGYNHSLLNVTKISPLYDKDTAWWLCNRQGFNIDDGHCDTATVAADPNNWKVFDNKVSYCLFEPMRQFCQLRYSYSILLTVIIANIIKAACMLATIYHSSPTLVTIGDAIESFLLRPEPRTIGVCTAHKGDFETWDWSGEGAIAQQWHRRPKFWLQSLSWTRWITCNILCGIGIAVGAYFFYDGRKALSDLGQDNSIAGIRALGFGQLNTNSLVKVDLGSFIPNVIVANLPQLILSFLFVTYNAVYTCQLVGREWDQFGLKRAPLRVSINRPGQRRTFYLGLPYRYAAVLVAISIILHWLMSQSLFLADLQALDAYPEDSSAGSEYKVGYSVIAIFAGLIASSVTIVIGIGFGLRRYSGSIPLVGSCSAAISAACHPGPNEPPDMVDRPLKWGVVDTKIVDGDMTISHCAFTADENARAPREGELCA